MTAARLETMFGSDTARICEFDLFYSPAGSELRGMRNFNPVLVQKTFAFGGLLANAVEQSKNKKGIVWASERAGSVVLSQALMTLANKNISFENQKHIVKMCWATCDPRPAFEATKRLGMLADKKLLHSNSHVKATLNATIVNAARARDHSDAYSWADYRNELANGTMVANTAIGAGALVGSLFIGSPLLAAVGTVTSGVGAAQFIFKLFKDRKEKW